MNISSVHLAAVDSILPPFEGFYQYIVAREGLYIRASNDLLDATVLIAATDRDLAGLAELEEQVHLHAPKIPFPFLAAVLASARRNLPNEAMYQFRFIGSEWKVSMPKQSGTPTSLTFEDLPDALLDLHSHGAMGAFFSGTDDGDEQGLRLYVVIGKVDTEAPEITCRIGVYGHFLDLPAEDLFTSLGPCVDKFAQPDALVYEPIEEAAPDDDLALENEPDTFETELGAEMTEHPNI